MPSPSAIAGPNAAALYLDLMKRCLTNFIYADAELHPVGSPRSLRHKVSNLLSRSTGGVRLVRAKAFDPALRAEGRDWPPSAHTMVGLKRLDNLQRAIERVLEDDVPGDLIETGVWRGGSVIFMRAVLKAHGVADRRVWVADSFAGLPPPEPGKYPRDAGDPFHMFSELAVSLEDVRRNFECYGLLDEQVRFLKGWFADTLPTAPVERLAVARLDGDMYSSTMEALTHLYPKLSPGGFLIVDDYGAVPGCRQAVEDYRSEHGITEEVVSIDWTGVFWRRAA
jgi:O-methyltransferase